MLDLSQQVLIFPIITAILRIQRLRILRSTVLLIETTEYWFQAEANVIPATMIFTELARLHFNSILPGGNIAIIVQGEFARIEIVAAGLEDGLVVGGGPYIPA